MIENTSLFVDCARLHQAVLLTRIRTRAFKAMKQPGALGAILSLREAK